MNYPTAQEVDQADAEQCLRWWRFLPVAHGSEQSAIITRIDHRLHSLGGITPELSKKVGWNKEAV